ncbi:CBS domain-containing protein [Parvularcula sp. IMCC14364]|uniref:CBS domain-containing protein n=1 Tax=Parvularcula sp. IMCC14364 TaxID=3067902 RepID=UPI0027418FC1|nr:CBS domain-containing protein [Parvularcula sp. IMCC14364]
MKIHQMLDQKGYDVQAIDRHATMEQAVGVLGEKNIGAVVVTDGDGSVCGILSERDVVRHMSRSGPGILTAAVDDYMTKNVVTCTRDADLQDVMEIMSKRRIRHLPVVEDGKLVGIVSIGDVVKRKIELAEEEAESLKQYIAAG